MNRREFLLGSMAAGVIPAAAGQSDSAIRQSYDVIVVGGGPAGVCAAIAAARGGMKTLVVDEGNCLGGMATKGLVGPFMTCYDRDGETQIIRGLFDETVRRLVKIGGAIHPSQCRANTAFSGWHVAAHDHVTPYDVEKLKTVLDEMCAEAGVETLFHTFFSKPLMEGGRIIGVEVVNKAGVTAYGAKVVVDATGDGDVAFRAGAPCELGDAARNGKMQPVSLLFRISGLPAAALEAELDARGYEARTKKHFSWHVEAAIRDGIWDLPCPHINMYRQVREDEWFVNCTRVVDVDATDPASVSKAEALGRRQIQTLMTVFRKYFPGGENVRLLSSASTLGVRESRHVRGDYWLDESHIREGKVPEDTISCCAYAIDLHGGKGASTTHFQPLEGRFYGIPYRSLLPQGVDNLLVAGRCISGSSVAAASFRVMPSAMAMGEAAGVAAALAVKGGVAPRQVNAALLRKTLVHNNAFVG